jgi:hypothetical protein
MRVRVDQPGGSICRRASITGAWLGLTGQPAATQRSDVVDQDVARPHAAGGIARHDVPRRDQIAMAGPDLPPLPIRPAQPRTW